MDGVDKLNELDIDEFVRELPDLNWEHSVTKDDTANLVTAATTSTNVLVYETANPSQIITSKNDGFYEDFFDIDDDNDRSSIVSFLDLLEPWGNSGGLNYVMPPARSKLCFSDLLNPSE
jgi:hypothetical protein